MTCISAGHAGVLARSVVDAHAGSDSAGESARDFLDEPGVAVGIVEGAEPPVAGMRRVGPADPCLRRERRPVPDVTYVDATAEEFVVRGFDVGYGQTAFGGAWRGRGDSFANVTEQSEPGGVNWTTRGCHSSQARSGSGTSARAPTRTQP